MKPIDRQVSERISILRMMLIVGIVVLHVPPAMTAADIGGDAFDYLKYGVSRGLFRATVPVLTCISGYLLFANLARYSYAKTVWGKAQRILFPFLLWNVPLVLALYVVQAQGIASHDFRLSLVPLDPATFADATFAYSDAPVNYPLDFLRDLFVIFLFSPVFLWMIRSAPWLGLLAVAAFFLGDADGLLILRNTMPACFYVGAMGAVLGWDLTRFDRLWPVTLAALLAATALIAAYGIENVTWFRLLSPPLIWIAAAPLVGSTFGRLMQRWSGDSFFLFLSHGPLLLVVYLAYQALGEPIRYPLFWIAAPVAVCAVSLATIGVIKRWAPPLAAFLVGDFKAIATGRKTATVVPEAT